MPGLFGIVEYNGGARLAEVFDRMRHAAKRFDRYQVDAYTGRDAGIGRVHFGWPDALPQPLWNTERTRCVFLGGELYNTAQLRQGLEREGAPVHGAGDAATVLSLYEREGMAFARQLNGLFAIALWDEPLRALTLINDRYGLMPVYYRHSGERLAFGHSLQVLCADPGLPRRMDDRTIADMLTFGYPLGDKTLLEGVSLLQPASVAVFSGGRFSLETYWDLTFPAEKDRWTEEEALDELGNRFAASVERRLAGRVLIPLSAGLDSRAIVAAAPRSMRLTTCTFGDPACADQVYARQIAHVRGADHHSYPLYPADVERYADEVVTIADGALDLFNAHGVSIADDLRQYGDCIVSGLGGELIRNFFGCPDDGADPEDYLRRHLVSVFPETALGDLLSPSYHQRIRAYPGESFQAAFASAAHAEQPLDRCDYFYLKQRVRRFTLSGVRLFGSRLGYRAPFLDNAFVEGATCLPPAMKRDSRFHKAFIRRRAPDLARIPLGGAGEPVFMTPGDRIVRKLRSVFSPGTPPPRRSIADYAGWVARDLAGFVRQNLLNERTLSRGYFSRAYLERLIDYPNLENGRAAAQLSVLLTLERWHRLFIDGDTGTP